MRTHGKPTLKFAALLVSLAALTLVQTGCGKMKKTAGIGKVGVDVADGKLTASLQLTKYQTSQGIAVGVPKLENSFVSVGPVLGGKGSVVQFTAPVKSILHAIADGSMPVSGLPDGRPIYGVKGGELPSFDLKVEQLNFRFYIGDEVFGIFLAIGLPSFKDPIQFPVKDSRGYVVAYAIAIPAGGAKGVSGLLVLFPLTNLSGLASS